MSIFIPKRSLVCPELQRFSDEFAELLETLFFEKEELDTWEELQKNGIRLPSIELREEVQRLHHELLDEVFRAKFSIPKEPSFEEAMNT